MLRVASGFENVQGSQSLELEIAQRTVRAGALFCSVAALFFAALYAVRGPLEFVAPHVFASAILAVIAAIPPRTSTVSLYAAVTTGLLLFGYQLLLLGRIDNGVTVWFLVPNMAAMILGLRTLAIYCLTITVTEVVGVVVAARAGWLRTQVILPEADVVMAISVISVTALCGIFAVITLRARQQLLRKLAARNDALQNALEETHRARNEAVEAAQAKERFFANLTHEIRTPLAGIAGTAELLQGTALSAEQKPLAKALGASTQNLTVLVNAMLDHARMRAGHVKVERAPVSLRMLAQDLRDLFGARAADKSLALKVGVSEDAPAWIETDGVKLRQIVDNLVSNAIKFTASGSVEVRMDCTDATGSDNAMCVVVEVADTGMGIAPEQIKAVFEPFVQGDASITRAYGGTGLGLAIARQLAELLGGTLQAASRPALGSTFTLKLPVVRADAPPDAAEVPSPAVANAAEFRVLLAEDNPVNQLVACAMLEKIEATVVVAENGMDAVEMAAKGNYHAILMDLQMPGMDGIAATREIRLRERLSGKLPIPVIAMTGNSPDDYGSACTAAGMTGFITKPVTVDQLRSVLAKLREPQ